MLDAFRMAIGTLTALPVPPPRTVDRPTAAAAMLLAPVAALPLAAVASAFVLAGQLLGLPALVTAALAIAAVGLSTKGLHLDGLADTADGLSASADRARALDIMRTGDSGPSGVATLVLVLLVQCAALAAAIEAGHGVFAAALAILTGRFVLAVCCTRGIASARAGGLGATVAGSVAPAAVTAVLVGVLAIASFTGMLAGFPWWHGACAVALGYVAAVLLLVRCVRRIGGITGDVLGACVETAVAAVLLALSI